MTSYLNDVEFHQQATAGGASRSVADNSVPDRGYMVGGARDLANQPFPEQQYPIEHFSVDHVRHHARGVRNQFGASPERWASKVASPPTNVYQGAWAEGDNVVLDASERISTYSSAITEAKKRGERAIYDVKRGRDINTKDVRVVN